MQFLSTAQHCASYSQKAMHPFAHADGASKQHGHGIPPAMIARPSGKRVLAPQNAISLM